MSYAKQLAGRGFYVFPCAKNSKKPIAGISWTIESTLDEKQIEKWERSYPGCNWGIDCGKSGLAVIDIDVKNNGFDTLVALDVNKGLKLPKTMIFETPTGGHHLLFSGDIKTGAGDIGPGVDTRSRGGYIVAPGSTIGGERYKVIVNAEIKPIPAWVSNMVSPKKQEIVRTNSDVDLDLAHNVQEAQHYLEHRAPPAIEGQGGDTHTFQVICHVRDYGISDGLALLLLMDHWNERCEPPWDTDDLERKIDNAYRYAQNSPGAKTAQAIFDAPVESAFEENKKDEMNSRLWELARLSPIEYDQHRQPAAEELNIRVSTLDKEVDQLRNMGQSRDEEGTGTQVLFPELELWSHPVHGARLLDELVAAIERYVILPRDAACAVALWVLHTYTHESSRVSPILCISSPDKRCGKTTLLSVTKALVHRPLMTSNITPAALYRAVEMWVPTLLIDEADTFLRDNDDLRGILNSGHVRDSAHVIRTVGESHEPRAFKTWAPKVIALIGRPHATLEDRSLMVLLRRKRKEESVERLRIDRVENFNEISRKCMRWAEDNMDLLKEADSGVPEGLNDRAADNWRCLLTIADTIGEGWSERARNACISLSLVHDENEAAGILLLQDFQVLFNKLGSRLHSTELAGELGRMEERPWPEWKKGKAITVKQIASILRPFGIRPKDLRVGKEHFKGYDKADFEDTFARYLADQYSDKVTSQQNQAVTAGSICDTQDRCHGLKSPETRITTELSPCHGTNTSVLSVETHKEGEISNFDWLN